MIVPVMLALWVPSQSVMPFSTEAMAARWKQLDALDRFGEGNGIGDIAFDQRDTGR